MHDHHAALGSLGHAPRDGRHHAPVARQTHRLEQLPLGVEEGKTKDEVEQAMKGHILSEATLTGLYARD